MEPGAKVGDTGLALPSHIEREFFYPVRSDNCGLRSARAAMLGIGSATNPNRTRMYRMYRTRMYRMGRIFLVLSAEFAQSVQFAFYQG
jgi:hypothetical protein